MANYSGIQKEETLKGLVYKEFFNAFGYEPNIDNTDFVITGKKARADLFSDGRAKEGGVREGGFSAQFLWAEAKKGIHDVFDMYTQRSGCI